MIVRPCPLPDLTIAPSVGRSPGVHMSDLYNNLYQNLEPKRFDKSKPMDPLRLEFGLAFEEALEEMLVARFGHLLGGERPGEFQTESGLYYTPDLIIIPKSDYILGEIKLTWLSCNECPISPVMAARWGMQSNWDGEDPDITFPPKFDKYFTQMKCYCYHLGILRARLLVCFVNGNYRPPRPMLLAWDFTFTEREVAEEWQRVAANARTQKLWEEPR